MSLELKKGVEFKKELIPQGSYSARIYEIIELGTIEGYKGKQQRKVRITFELPTEKKVFKSENGEQPLVISKEYTVSSHEKSGMRELVEACIAIGLFQGEADTFDIKQLMGETCLVSIKHKEGEKGKFQYVDSTSALPKGLKVEKAINKTRTYEIDTHDKDVFSALPQFVQDKITSSEEYQEKYGMTISADDVPFD